MTHVPEGWLALYAGGDLEPKEFCRVKEHLATCWECRDLLAEFRENLVALEIRPLEPTTDELRGLLQGVIQQLQKSQKSAVVRLGWAVASISAAASVAGVVLLHPEQSRNRVNPRLAATAHLSVPYRPTAQISLPNLKLEMAHAQRVPRLASVGIRDVSLLAEHDGPRILKMTTADPNVVILWQLDERTHDRD